jgi:hypothetical protein
VSWLDDLEQRVNEILTALERVAAADERQADALEQIAQAAEEERP